MMERGKGAINVYSDIWHLTWNDVRVKLYDVISCNVKDEHRIRMRFDERDVGTRIKFQVRDALRDGIKKSKNDEN